MTKEELKECIDNISTRISRDHLSNYLKNHHSEVYEFIIESTRFLDKFDNPTDKNKKISIFERLYCIYNDIQDRPKCKHCNTEYVCGFNKQENEYKKWCSPKCQASDKDCINKTKSTKIARYGSCNYNNNEKCKLTRIEKYGSYHPKDFTTKLKTTKLNRYGNENYVNIEQTKATKLNRYGDENYVNSERNKETKLKRYGDENYNNRDKFKQTLSNFSEEKKNEIKNRRLSTNINRYGHDFAVQNKDIQDKIKRTTLERYGVNSVILLNENRDKVTNSIKGKSWNFITNNKEYIPLFEHDEYIWNRDKNKMWKWKHVCGHEFESTYDDGACNRCPKCYPNNKYGISKMEIEIYDYIKSIVTCDVFNHTKENRNIIDSGEIDIYIPDMKIGIEFNGLYYHSENQGKNRTYHLKKTEECEAKGIRLIHIFEDEYVNHRKTVLSKIRNLLVKDKMKIYARKCDIRPIDNTTKDKFISKYHIQGSDVSSVRLGLFYGRHLVAVMTFVKSRFNRNYEWELSRYCTISNFTIVGGASKLLKHFERNYNPKSIITFADRRWSNGNLYHKLGFNLKNISSPDYFYIRNGHRYSRLQFQKHKLKSILDTFDEKLTEVENMRNNGYDRIFDCGNYVFTKTLN